MRKAGQTFLAATAGDGRAVAAPKRKTFVEFLAKDARVPVGGGEHGPYSFEGREVLHIIAAHFDTVLGTETGAPLADSSSSIAGGAQWGKTVVELNLAAFCTSQQWLNVGVFLPSDDLVQGIVDTKFRPDVVDQIPWFAEMTKVGRAVNKSGKQVDRKGAFLVTDGKRKATGMVIGLQKVPTSYTFDVAVKDELDDIPAKNEKFVKGRLTSSPLRWQVNVGTQRVHGRGQHAKWKGGSQGVVMLPPMSRASEHAACVELMKAPEGWVNAEEAFPGIVRCQLGAAPSPNDPKLTWAGDFRRDSDPDFTVAMHDPSRTYYLAHPMTGEPINRRHPVCVHRAPARLVQRQWGIRVSQLSIAAIGLSQIVAQFQLAVADPDELTVFRCDVLALPQSLSQAITPAIVQRAREIAPYDLRLVREPGRACFAGLDAGDRWWLSVREIESPLRKRVIYAASIPAADAVARILALAGTGLWDALFMDQRPLVAEAREIALALNGLNAVDRWPVLDESHHFSFPGGLAWDALRKRWRGLKAAVVRFDKKSLGAGIEHGLDLFSADGGEKCVPLIRCNREESVDRVVREMLTPVEGVNDLAGGKLRVEPAKLLPKAGPAICETMEAHFITGSERVKEKDGSLGSYVDGVPNHLVFADAYSALCELECGGSRKAAPLSHRSISKSRAATNDAPWKDGPLKPSNRRAGSL